LSERSPGESRGPEKRENLESLNSGLRRMNVDGLAAPSPTRPSNGAAGCAGCIDPVSGIK
jgi:hypothetical protein